MKHAWQQTTKDPATEHPAFFEVEDLRVRFELPSGPLDVLNGLNFRLHQGETLCVVGESGSGKTVMTHALMGLLSVNPGIIQGHFRSFLGDKPVDLLEGLDGYIQCKTRRGQDHFHLKAGWQKLYRKRVQEHLVGRIGLIFQNPKNALDPLFSVGQQLMESVAVAEKGLSRGARRARALEWLKKVHIDRAGDVMRLYPHELSGGMCQRVAIAQILALQTQVVIADEPTTGLDATIQAGILDLLKEVQRSYGLSVLLITHDFGVVERLADRILVLYQGDQIELGDAEEMLTPGAAIHPYTESLLRNVRALESGDLYAAGTWEGQ